MEVFKGLDLHGLHRPENIIAEFSDYMNRANYTTDYALRYFRDQGYDAFTVEGESVEHPRELPEDNIWFKSR